METKSPRAYSTKSKYKPGDFIVIVTSQQRFADFRQLAKLLLEEESQWLTPTETLYLKSLELSFQHKKDQIK